MSRVSPSPLSGEPSDTVPRLLTSIAGSRPPMSSAAERLQYPKARRLLGADEHLRAIWEAHGAELTGEAVDLLRRPLRAYPLARRADGAKRFALISAWQSGRAAIA